MVSEQNVSKNVQAEEDIEISDIFNLNAYEYYVVTDVVRESDDIVVRGYIRDGIYSVGQSEPAEYSASTIIDKLENHKWKYRGIYVYGGEDINGDPVDYDQIITQSAYEEFRETNN